MSIEEAQRRIVRETVVETLKCLGFNVEDPAALRADMDHLRRWRGYVETSARGLFTAGGIVVLTAIGYGLKYMLFKG